MRVSNKFLNWDTLGTAVITGASAGIGKEFAIQLAKIGFNLVLVARREEKLKILAEELNKKYGTSCKTISADLSTNEGIILVENMIKKSDDLSVLINNAGFGTRGHFMDVSLEKHLIMNMIHITAPTRLCYVAIPKMAKNGHGAIINLSSLATFTPTKEATIYSGSKAYLRLFSRALCYEIHHLGTKVQALCPGFTYSEFHEVGDWVGFKRTMIPKFMWQSAEDVVKYSLKKLKKNKTVIIPGIVNKLIAFAVSIPYFGRKLQFMINSKLQNEMTSSQ